MKKKRNGWKIAFIVLIVIVLFFAIIWMFGDDEEEGDVPRDGQTVTSSSVSTGSGNTAETASAINFDGVVREPQRKVKGNNKDTVTILIYMNGSDLETDDGEATTDLQEMIDAGGSDNVNILVQTMGTKKWQKKLGVASDRSQIYCINKNGMKLVKDDLGQLDCTVSSTLKDFVSWGASNYPADRYFLLFWNHGGGPVYGFGNDQYAGEYDALTIDEIQTALRGAGVYFDFIGMDCCIMSSLEVCCAFYDFCDYTILCEDFESGLGWSYTEWLKKLYQDTSISVPDLGKVIVDSMVSANDAENENAILSVIDEGVMKVLYSSWVNFAYANEDALLGTNYSQKKSRSQGGRVHPTLIKKGFFSDWLSGDSDDVSLSDYYITDIMAVAQNIDSDESKALSTALSKALVYVNAIGDDTSFTGISVTLPYGDSEFYSELKTIFTNCGFEEEYITWLGNFTSADGSDSFYDYDDWDDEWSGWDDYDDDFDWDDDDDWSIFDFLFEGWDDDDEYDDWDDYWYEDDDFGWSDWDDWDDWE